MLAPDVLKDRISSGITAFHATPFHSDGSLDQSRLESHVAFLAQHRPTALARAGGAGEIFSLTLAEHEQVVRTAVLHANGVPVIGGAGYMAGGERDPAANWQHSHHDLQRRAAHRLY